MPKLKVKKKDTHIDMTPMVDLAFLLITFFMLTIQFKPPELVTVATPSSVSTVKTTQADQIIITIDNKGAVFVGTRGQATRDGMLDRVEEELGQTLSEEQRLNFKLIAEIGVNLKQLPQFLELTTNEQKELYKSPDFQGINADTTGLNGSERTDFYKYVRFAREAYAQNTGEAIRVMLKADNDAPVRVVKNVLTNLAQQRANRVNFITNQEGYPDAWVGYEAPQQVRTSN